MGRIMAGSDQSNKEQAIKEQDGDWAGYLPSVILSHPQMGENIGASARAMKNCGLSTMHVVNPRDGWPNPAAVSMASSADDLLDQAQLHNATREAAAPYTLIAATTARRRGMMKEILSPREAAQKLIAHARAGVSLLCCLGRNDQGLIMMKSPWRISSSPCR